MSEPGWGRKRGRLTAQRADDFARGLSTALVEYALGHPVGFSDEPLIERMVTEAKAQNYTLRTFIHTLIQSLVEMQGTDTHTTNPP
jgi:hypothetical protein